MSVDLMDAYWQAPPTARTLATAILGLSVGVHTGLIPSLWVFFHRSLLFKIPPEIWRPVTSFMITSPKLGLILDTYFVYQYLSQLERGNPKFTRREDLLWYLIFVCSVILTIDSFFLNSGLHLQGLVMAICYTATQDQRGIQAQFFFFQVPAQLIPYCMLLVSLIMGGPQACFLQIIGLLAAHLHDFLTRLWPEFGGGPNLAPTPGFMSRLVRTPRIVQRGYGTAVRGTLNTGGAAAGGGNGGGSGAGSGPLPDSWKTRGSGHRLG